MSKDTSNLRAIVHRGACKQVPMGYNRRL